MKEKYVLGIDIGTTTVRSLVYDSQGQVVGEAHSSVDPIIPNPGWYEIDPDVIWDKVSIRHQDSKYKRESLPLHYLHS